jgi:hypothetical protein
LRPHRAFDRDAVGATTITTRDEKAGREMDPNPDYDASDEIEYFFNWLPWALRGVYPPPAYPPV